MLTQGKWEIQEHGGLFAIGTHDDAICKLWELEEETHDKLEFENAEANARLIAAAPETIEMLKDIAKRIADSDEWWMDGPEGGGFDLEAIEALIAKAQS